MVNYFSTSKLRGIYLARLTLDDNEPNVIEKIDKEEEEKVVFIQPIWMAKPNSIKQAHFEGELKLTTPNDYFFIVFSSPNLN